METAIDVLARQTRMLLPVLRYHATHAAFQRLGVSQARWRQRDDATGLVPLPAQRADEHHAFGRSAREGLLLTCKVTT
jgi:hypothetical protein